MTTRFMSSLRIFTSFSLRSHSSRLMRRLELDCRRGEGRAGGGGGPAASRVISRRRQQKGGGAMRHARRLQMALLSDGQRVDRGKALQGSAAHDTPLHAPSRRPPACPIKQMPGAQREADEGPHEKSEF